VGQIPLGGGMTKILVAASGPATQSVFVDGTYLCWSNPGTQSVVCMPVGGGSPVPVATSYAPYNVIADATTVYWAASPGDCANTVDSLPLPAYRDAGPVNTDNLLNGLDYGFVLSGSTLIISAEIGCRTTTEEVVGTVDVTNGTSTILASQFLAGDGGTENPTYGPLAFDSGQIYWSDSAGHLFAMPMSTRVVSTIATGVSPPRPPTTGVVMLADSARIYWPQGANVMAVPVAGGTPKALAVGLVPNAIAQDAAAIYWTDSKSGTVNKVAK